MDHLLQCHESLKTDFVRGENCHLFDAAGRRFVDLDSGIWCTALGHNHPRIQRALIEQAGRLVHLGTRWPSPLAERAAVAVLGAAGLDDGKCVFLSSGSEAVEFGAQAIRRVTGRGTLLAFTTSYLAAYGSAGRKGAEEWRLLDWAALDGSALERQLDAIPFAEVGGFVLEPGGSSPGFVRFPSAAVVRAIAGRVRAHGGLLQSNEITTGMGRTGRWFGFEHYDLTPDIVSLGKGLGNGYPVSAVAMTRDVAAALERGGLHYAQSHQNDPLGCAVAAEVIAELREGGWVERGRAAGAGFLAGLERLKARHPVVADVRGRGMLLALELAPHARIDARTAHRALLERGFLANYYHPAGNILRFSPALTIDEADLRGALAALDDVLAQAG